MPASLPPSSSLCSSGRSSAGGSRTTLGQGRSALRASLAVRPSRPTARQHPSWACSGSKGHLRPAWAGQDRRHTRYTPKGGPLMPKEDERTRASSLRKIFLGSHARPEREEKVLRYVIHRANEGARLHDVVGEDYVRRNCSQAEIEKIVQDPELVHACRENLWRTFGSGELDPSLRTHVPLSGVHRRLAEHENNGASTPPGA